MLFAFLRHLTFWGLGPLGEVRGQDPNKIWPFFTEFKIKSGYCFIIFLVNYGLGRRNQCGRDQCSKSSAGKSAESNEMGRSEQQG